MSTRSIRTSQKARRRGGFALVAALALLVVLGSIGAAMVRLSTVQQASSSLAIIGARANWAAQAGVEWAIHEARDSGSCPSGSFGLAEEALSGFQIVVTCGSTQHREGSEVRSNLAIRVEASFGTLGSPLFVFREIEASIVL